MAPQVEICPYLGYPHRFCALRPFSISNNLICIMVGIVCTLSGFDAILTGQIGFCIVIGVILLSIYSFAVLLHCFILLKAVYLLKAGTFNFLCINSLYHL